MDDDLYTDPYYLEQARAQADEDRQYDFGSYIRELQVNLDEARERIRELEAENSTLSIVAKNLDDAMIGANDIVNDMENKIEELTALLWPFAEGAHRAYVLDEYPEPHVPHEAWMAAVDYFVPDDTNEVPDEYPIPGTHSS